MASAKTVARVERLIWIFIYGGLLTLVLGLASLSGAPVAAWSLIIFGGCVAAAGFVLIWVRSRMHADG